MSEAIDAIRDHFNQAPIPKAKCLLDERDRVNAMIDAIEVENAKLRKLVNALLQCHVEDTDTCAKCNYRSPLHGGCMADVSADNLGVEVGE